MWYIDPLNPVPTYHAVLVLFRGIVNSCVPRVGPTSIYLPRVQFPEPEGKGGCSGVLAQPLCSFQLYEFSLCGVPKAVGNGESRSRSTVVWLLPSNGNILFWREEGAPEAREEKIHRAQGTPETRVSRPFPFPGSVKL